MFPLTPINFDLIPQIPVMFSLYLSSLLSHTLSELEGGKEYKKEDGEKFSVE